MGIIQDLTGSSAKKAANAAAADTYGKQQTAIGDLNAYGDTLPGQYNDIAKGYDPYRSAGTDALSMLRNGMGLGGPGGSQSFTDAYHATPGYEAGLNTGSRAVASHFNAGGMGQSGAAMKGLDRFGMDYEDQKSGDYLTRLMGLSEQGMQAEGAATGLEATGLGAKTGVRQSAFGGSMNAAGTIGQGMVAGEQAKQSALTNLMQTGAYLAGSAMGVPPVGMGSRLQTPTPGQQGNGGTYMPAPRMM